MIEIAGGGGLGVPLELESTTLTSCKCAVLASRFADFGTGATPPNPPPEAERWISGRGGTARSVGDDGVAARWNTKWRFVVGVREVGVCGRWR